MYEKLKITRLTRLRKNPSKLRSTFFLLHCRSQGRRPLPASMAKKNPPRSPSPATTLRPPRSPLFNRRSLFLLLKIRCMRSMQPLCLFCQALLLETPTVKSRHPRPCLQSLMFNKVWSRTRIPQFLKP